MNYKKLIINQKTFTQALTALAMIPLMATVVNACPGATLNAKTSRLTVSTAESSVSLSISKAGKFTATRVLVDEVPANAASCTVTLEGRYLRNLSTFSNVELLGTTSSTAQTVAFTAKNLPTVRPYRARKQVAQPIINVRVVTNCVDSNDINVLSDTTGVVARYVDCGNTKTALPMTTFIRQLKNKLARLAP